MPDLVDRLAFAVAHVKSIRAIYDHTVHITDVLVPVNDALRNDNGFRIVHADVERHHLVVSGGRRPVVPKPDVESRRADKAERAGRVDMLMWGTRKSRTWTRDVIHER